MWYYRKYNTSNIYQKYGEHYTCAASEKFDIWRIRNHETPGPHNPGVQISLSEEKIFGRYKLSRIYHFDGNEILKR